MTMTAMGQVPLESFEAWAALRRRGGHRLAVALEMLTTVCSAGVHGAELQRANRLAGGQVLADAQARARPTRLLNCTAHLHSFSSFPPGWGAGPGRRTG